MEEGEGKEDSTLQDGGRAALRHVWKGTKIGCVALLFWGAGIVYLNWYNLRIACIDHLITTAMPQIRDSQVSLR